MRSYEDGCAIAHALDIVGERWALLVVRELMLGPKRFTDLRAGLPHAGPNVLSQRLRDLEDNAILRRRKLPPPAASQIYELTDLGRELEPVISTLARWGIRSPRLQVDTPIGTDSVILAMRTFFAPDQAQDQQLKIELRLGDERFGALVDDGTLKLERGGLPEPDAVIDTSADTLKGMAFRRGRLAPALADGTAAIHGDSAAAEAFLSLFAIPARADAEGRIPAV